MGIPVGESALVKPDLANSDQEESTPY